MHDKLKVALGALVIFVVPSMASAEDSGPPNIDLQKTCRVVEKAIGDVFGDAITAVFERCVENEKSTREQLVKNWATYSAADKSLCMQPKVYQPSYAEWLTCAEMQRDVRKMRNERNSAPSPDTSRQSPDGRGRSNRTRCPTVQHGADGAMISAVACALY
jgi:hypothetical protein